MGLLDRLECGWHQNGKGRRICRRCAPRVMETLKTTERQRDAYASSLSGASEKLGELDRKLTEARKLLAEAAEGFRRGRLGRPVSNRIVAFLEA